jgi:hypothetical protein
MVSFIYAFAVVLSERKDQVKPRIDNLERMFANKNIQSNQINNGQSN